MTREEKIKEVLQEAGSPTDIANVLEMLKLKAILSEDVIAAKTFLEYYLSKPKSINL